jgi:hypothetical protein
LREEDPDGGLLFNPDTNQIRVLNVTGLLIWQACDGTHDLPSLVTAIRESFDAVPDDQVDHQVTEFVNEMVASGFIGIVEN